MTYYGTMCSWYCTVSFIKLDSLNENLDNKRNEQNISQIRGVSVTNERQMAQSTEGCIPQNKEIQPSKTYSFDNKEVVEGAEYSAEDPPVIGTSGTCKFGFTNKNKINVISMRFDIFSLMAQIEKHVKEFAARRKKGISVSI